MNSGQTTSQKQKVNTELRVETDCLTLTYHEPVDRKIKMIVTYINIMLFDSASDHF